MHLGYPGEASMSNGATHKVHYCFDLIEIIKTVLGLKALDGIKHTNHMMIESHKDLRVTYDVIGKEVTYLNNLNLSVLPKRTKI